MMNTYKITNITNRLPKRDRKFNTTLAIEYVDKMTKKTVNVKPNDSVFLSVSTLPLSVHRLRIKNLIIVSEESPVVVAKAAKKAAPKKVAPKKKAAPKAEAKPAPAKKKGRPATVKKEE